MSVCVWLISEPGGNVVECLFGVLCASVFRVCVCVFYDVCSLLLSVEAGGVCDVCSFVSRFWIVSSFEC